MIQRLTFCDFRDAFRRFDRLDTFSYDGAKALFDYLEEADENWELDVVALCCDYNEDTIENVLSEHEGIVDLDELMCQTMVVWHDEERVLYAQF